MAILRPEQIAVVFPLAEPNIQAAMAEICEINLSIQGRLSGLKPNSPAHKRARRFETRPDNHTMRRLFTRAVEKDPFSNCEPTFHVGTVEWERVPGFWRPDRKMEENIEVHNFNIKVRRRVMAGFGLRDEDWLAMQTGQSNASAISNILVCHDTPLTPVSSFEAPGLSIESFAHQNIPFLLERFTQRLKQASSQT